MIIMFPDLNGEASKGAFGRLLAKLFPEALLIPILNGKSPDRLHTIAKVLTKPFEPLVVPGEGVLLALRVAYHYVATKYPTMPVVRIDTDEHPPRLIPELLGIAERANGMAVGDLVFNSETLRSGSLDEFINLSLFPNLYRHFTGGRIALSGAYGFQAFTGGVIGKVLLEAQRIVAEAEREVGGTFLWGWDAAMILGAMGASVPVEIMPVKAEVLRDRARAKITRQLEDTLAICCAARRLYKLDDALPHRQPRIEAED